MAAHSVSERIFDKWFSFPNVLLLAPIPAVTAALFALADQVHFDRRSESAADQHRIYDLFVSGIQKQGARTQLFVTTAASFKKNSGPIGPLFFCRFCGRTCS
jgi:cytochrome bd-type quinol oxidase subunit 2